VTLVATPNDPGALHAGAYGAWAADQLLPDVIRFIPGTIANWEPWQGSQNGKGLSEDIASNVIKMIVNQDFSSGSSRGRSWTTSPTFPRRRRPVDPRATTEKIVNSATEPRGETNLEVQLRKRSSS
jgi:hypothetical protein